ncbi:MAG TPA: hypothetical protein VL977_00400, partial [Solirubrobacteraceae bacterium]|nr:hypothetical protein [Solirubrobacteraceae bacterium]
MTEDPRPPRAVRLRVLAVAAAAGALAGGSALAAVVVPPDAQPTPSVLAAQIATVANAAAVQWTAHESGSGALVDPVLGPLAGTYGVAMTGQAVIVAGLEQGSQQLISDGVQSLLSEVAHPDRGSFELLGVSEAYAFDQAQLAGNPAWAAARARIARFLRRRGQSVSDLGVCFTSPRCYTNLKLVSAVGDLALLRTGLRGDARGALLRHPAGLRAKALAWIEKAVQNTGDDAYRSGGLAFTGAGILSDPTENPLAYHALSTLMLGRAILMLGRRTPRSARLAFARAARALAGLLAPDGDGTYIGRGQGQVWTVAATIDALSIAAELTGDPTWRGRYLAGVQLELARLEALYPASGWGLPLVPRFAGEGQPRSYSGIDHYANTVEYDGLALWALDDAASAVAAAAAAPREALPASADGAFVDPSHARFAAVTEGELWFAVHAIDSNPGDARYGFGLVAAEIDTTAGWEPALPERPLTAARTAGGLALIRGARTLYPAGRRIAVSPSGAVSVTGGWSTGRRVVSGPEQWTFRPLSGGQGVALSFAAAPGDRYAVQVWYEAGARILRSAHGVSVAEPDGSTQAYTFGQRVAIAAGAQAASAYEGSLRSLVLTVPAAAGPRTIAYTTTFSAPSPALGSSGASGTSGTSGASGT